MFSQSYHAGSLILFLTLSWNVVIVSARSFFVDSSCPSAIATAVVPEAISMAQSVAAQTNTLDFLNFLTNALVPGISSVQITGLLGDIAKIATLTPAVSADAANIVFFCDGDSRWRFATNDEWPGQDARSDSQKAWIDPKTDLIYDQRVSLASEDRQQPGCLPNDGTVAQTYTNMRTFDFDNPRGSKIAITICNTAFQNRQFLALSQVPSNKNLASKSFKNLLRPSLDNYKLLSVTIVHELAHQILDGSQRYLDSQGAKSYGFSNIKAMGVANSIENADTLAYTCLGANLISRGFSISNSGNVQQNRK